jgi:hypothetical protein
MAAPERHQADNVRDHIMARRSSGVVVDERSSPPPSRSDRRTRLQLPRAAARWSLFFFSPIATEEV